MSLFRQLSSSAAASLSILVSTAVGGVVAARCLLPVGRGQLAAAILWPTFFVTIGSLGLVEALTYYCASRPDRSREFLSAALATGLVLALILMAGGYYVLPLVLSHYDPATIRCARWFLAYVPISLAATLMMAAAQGNLHIGAYNVLRAMVQVLSVVGMLGAVVLGYGTVRGFVAATFAANAATLVAAAIFVLRKGWVGSPLRLPAGARLLRFGVQSHVGSLASVMNLRLDQILMSALLTAPFLGLYVVAVAVAGVANLPFSTLDVVALPRIAREIEPANRARSWGRLLKLSLCLQVVCVAALWVVTPYIIRICFGSPFDSAVGAARILVVASLPLGANILLSSGFRASNRPMTPSAAQVLSLLVTAAGLWRFLPLYGIEAAAWVSLAAYSITCVFLLSCARYQLGVQLRDLLAPTLQDWQEARTFLQRRGRGDTQLAL